MAKLIYLLTLICLRSVFNQETDIDLLLLKSNWIGNGTSVLYPGMIKLLNDKMDKQISMISTSTQISVDSNWEMNIDIKYTCETEPIDFGIGLWLTVNNPVISPVEYLFDKFMPTYGMKPSIDGLGLVYTKKALYTSMMKSQNISRSDILYRSKSCKIYGSDDQSLNFKIKYRNKVLGIYSVESKEKKDDLCLQFTDIDNFNSFYITASAMIDSGRCAVDLKNFSIKQSERLFQFIDSKDKKEGDGYFAYFNKSDRSRHQQAWDEYNEKFKLYRENSKLLAQELLEFADLNQKELGDKFSKQIKEQLDSVVRSVEVIGMEVHQLESLSTFIEQDRKTTTINVNDFSDQIFQWLEQMSDAYDRVDEETLKIYESISRLGINDKLTAIIDKSEKIVDTLDSLLFQTKGIKDDPLINSLDDEKLKLWDDHLMNIKTSFRDKIQADSDTASQTLKTAAYMFLGGLAVLIFFAFGFMYWKIQKVIRHKRML